MEIYTDIKSPQHQAIIAPYPSVQTTGQKSTWVYKYVSPMELLRLLWRTKSEYQNLTLSERAILSILLDHVNLSKAQLDGYYEAYPSVESIIEFAGSSDRAVRGYIKGLKDKDWVKIISGRGKGQSNHYYINAPKIVACYKLSNPEDGKPYRTGEGFEAIKSVPYPIKRNTSGLQRGRSVNVRTHAPVK